MADTTFGSRLDGFASMGRLRWSRPINGASRLWRAKSAEPVIDEVMIERASTGVWGFIINAPVDGDGHGAVPR
jgi:hypothetical protein